MLNKKLMPIIASAVVVLGVSAFTVLNGRAEVESCGVQKGTMQEVIELQGKVALENNEKIYSKLAGTIKELAVKEGGQVRQGDMLAQIDVTDIGFAIRKAEAELSAARANTLELKKSIKPEQVKSAEAQLQQAKAAQAAAEKDYEYKKANSENTKMLYDSGSASLQELRDNQLLLTQAENTLENSRQNVSMCRYNLDLLRQGVSGDAINASAANEQAIQVLIEEMKNNAGKAGIYSPMKGVVLSKSIDMGKAVQTGEMLFEIGDYDSAYIRVDVLVDDIAKIKIGQKAILEGDVLGEGKIQGQVYYMAPKAESRVSSLGVEQQRLEVRIRFDNSRYVLKPGYTLDVDIITNERASTLYVPDKAVFELDGRDQVFVINKNRLELREIKKGFENDDYIEVLSGLKEGDKVVVDPDNGLKNGMRVKSSQSQ